ncbi:hypothetical protein QBC40DRAFT_332750 [Triangularia verruculosa]|uniref:Uncharacterized protein n=1 Tax=Triangularia verruculosa TaxID=2587418 RepID=A0AAN6XHI4_9PEZI|nr:hypothetical protein QBC40DRAFT_332750 [Triangularia verruculosa]
MQKPLSESLQKLRRAQRALTRRKRRSKVRVSFRHSTGSRTSGTAKRSSRQLKAGDVKPGGTTPKSRPFPPVPSSSEDVGGCFGSPSKPPRPPPKDDIRGVVKPGDEKDAGLGRRGAAQPKTPAQAPEAGALNKAQGPRTEHIRTVENKKGKAQAGKSVETSIKRRPIQTPSGQPRYSVFPKSHHRRKPSVNERSAPPVNPEDRDSIRRSLIQQRRLSALVPSDAQNIPTPTPAPQKDLPDLSKTPLTRTNDEKVATGEPKTEPRSFERTLDKFARELEEFARSTQAFDRTPALLSTPATTQTQVSVRTVQEFLPYRQQFQEAGLAVASVEQKAPEKQVRRHPPHKKLADSRLNHFGSNAPAQGVSSSGTKESSSGTVIHKPRRDPMTLSVADETPEIQEDKVIEKTSAETVTSPKINVYSASSSTFIEPVKLAAVQKKVIRLRPSTVFLANKPLPDAPELPQPSSSKDTRETVVSSQSSARPGGCQKLGSSTGTEKEPLLPLSGQQQNSIGTGSSNSKTSKRKEVDRGSVKDEKSLPAIPPPRSLSQARHGIALPSTTSWTPTAAIATTSRQLPTTIVEEREPSPEKKEHKILNHKPSMNQQHVSALNKPVIAPAAHKSPIAELATKEITGITATPAQPPKSTTPFGVKRNIVNTTATTTTTAAATNNTSTIISSSKKLELPKTWERHPLGTPSSFKKALDDVVRKLDAIEIGKQRTPLGSLSPAENKKRLSSSGSNKPPSPTQRLQKAAAMRRDRIDAENERLNAPTKPLQPTPQPQKQQYIPGMVPPPLPMPPPGGFRPRERESSRAQGQNNMVMMPPLRRRPSRQFVGMGMVGMEDDRDISDRDVLKGLKIICAASADAEFDGLIQRETGLRLRRFLADLRTFEFLDGGGGGQGGQRVSKRRGPSGAVQHVPSHGMGQIEKRRRDVQVERESRRRSIRGLEGFGGVRGLVEGKGGPRESKDNRRRSIRLEVDRESRRRSFRGVPLMR